MELVVPSVVLDRILGQARAEAPRECCGLLIGRPGVVEREYATRNLDSSETHFTVDPVDHFAALRVAREAGLAVIGAYHSHPTCPAVPSEVDLHEANDDDFVHLIVGVDATQSFEIRAYWCSDGNFVPLTLVPDVR
jgi:proteasome lid subunit RPN8/RPN11